MDGASVDFGGVQSPSVTFISSTSLSVVTPAHAEGVVDVTVTNPDLQWDTLVNGFTYVDLSAIPDVRLHFYHNDHLGTPLFLTDGAGTVVWEGEYYPFGDIYTQDTDPDGDGANVYQPFRFPGQFEDFETGLYYNYFRDYDPTIGRYVEADPIGLAGGVNLFTYAEGNPANNIDLMGLAGIGGGFYFVAGAEGSLNSSTCCEDNALYEVKYITACGGLGLGVKGTASVGVSFAGISTRGDCPRTRYYFKHENVFLVRSVNVQGDSTGPSAGIDVGLYGISTAWVFCSDTILSKKEIGCCE